MLTLRKPLLLILLAGILSGFGNLYAQVEIRYIDSEKIYQESKEFQEVMKKINQMEQDLRKDLAQKGQALQDKAKDFQAKQLVLSEENKQKIQEELQKESASLQQQEYETFGQNGKYYQKANELRAPLVNKVNMIIQKVAREKGYDLILDKATMGVVFAKDIYDITNVILEELKKASSTGNQ